MERRNWRQGVDMKKIVVALCALVFSTAAFAAVTPEEARKFQAVVMFDTATTDGTPGVLTPGNIIQARLLVQHTSGFATATFRSRLTRVDPLYSTVGGRSLYLDRPRRFENLRDGTSIDFVPINQDGPGIGLIGGMRQHIPLGLYQYTIEVYLGSSRKSPDRVFHSMVKVVDENGCTLPTATKCQIVYLAEVTGQFPFAFIDSVNETKEEGTVAYQLGGTFATPEGVVATGIRQHLVDPTTGDSYPIVGEMRDGYVVGIVTVPFSVVASRTLVVTWDFNGYSRASASTTLLNDAW